MELAFELAHNMYKAGNIFSLVFVGQDDVLAPVNSFKEKNIWKGKVEVMELRALIYKRSLLCRMRNLKSPNL